MNRIKLLMLILALLVSVTSAWSQELNVYGTLSKQTYKGCTDDPNEYVLDELHAKSYLFENGVVIDYTGSGTLCVSCSISEVEQKECGFTALRSFRIFVIDGEETILSQSLEVIKVVKMTGSLKAVVDTACYFDMDKYLLDEDQALDYFSRCNIAFDENCNGDDVRMACLVTDLDETECAFTAERSFLIFSDCDPEGVTLSQTITVQKGFTQKEFTLPDTTFAAGSLEEAGFPGQYDTEAISMYLKKSGIQFPSCWNYYTANYTEPVEVWNEEFCQKTLQVTFRVFHVSEPIIWCDGKFEVHQNVILSPKEVRQEGEYMDDFLQVGSCDPASSMPPIEDIRDFAKYGVTFSNYLYPFTFDITYEDEEQETEDCKTSEIIRTYTIENNCSDPPFHTELVQFITFRKVLRVTGMLETQYVDEGSEAETYETVSDLKNKVKGMHLYYSCEESDLQVSHRDVSNYLGNKDMTMRWYILKSNTCEDLKDSIPQLIQSVLKEPEGFHLDSYTETSAENANDGTATLSKPSYLVCESCPECPDRKLFKVRWSNLTNDKIYETDPEDEKCDIYFIDSLCGGKYKVEVFPICEDIGVDQSKPIFSDNFEIKEANTELYVVFGVRYFSWGSYASAFGLHLYLHDDLDFTPTEEYLSFHPADPPEGVEYEGNSVLQSVTGYGFHHGYTIDLNSTQHKYRWDIQGGSTNFDPYELYAPGGSDAGMTFQEWVQMYSESYGEHFVVAKGTHGMPRSFTFKMLNNEGDKILKSKRKPLYYEPLMCSNDPNEIFGPSGYTNADSTIVRMINATDDINYTIQFENDPEFATAAAARVKITCPLDEHADPTTFRLGNFGFGEYTFDVPPMTSYYNNRINMDSLGYWLDVTASIAVPENEAYWIFQTIDPETGMAPIDSLGFLKVNDTLTGEGEGFVTFSVSPRPGANRALIQTNDSIVERAVILFDENEEVPTNTYKNVFDAVAPTSVLVCDTTGAFEDRMLNIGFEASDDEGGSGVNYIDLYVSIDRNGFELVGTIEPDSVFSYPMMTGSHFEFMSLATDHVGNKEPNKPYAELVYSFGNPPTDLKLDNKVFAENDVMGTLIGNFSTVDDQNTDNFVYTLVDGMGSDDNALFRIEDNQLKTNFDFRCYGSYEFNIRVRTTDVTTEYLEKSFVLSATQTEETQTVFKNENLCPGQSIYFGGEYLTAEGLYWDTLSTVHGCDSIVSLRITMLPAPVTTLVDDEICFGDDYTDNGFNLSSDSLAAILSPGWSMQSDSVLYLDNYVENRDGCYDTTRLTLTVHPSFEMVTDAVVCQSDLPYVYLGSPFFEDTVVVRTLHAISGCDSTLVLNLTVNPASTQTNDLTEGWNWFSTYIDQSNGQGLANLETALGSHGVLIKSQSGFVQYYPDYNAWYGGLSEIDNKSMFMIQTDGNLTTDLLGCYAGDDTITLRPGWTWIGYPMPDSMYLSQTPTAVSGYPSNEDIFKSKNAFASYDADYGQWYGTLSVLHPGEGYLYKSNSTNNKTLYYPDHSRTEGVFVEAPETHWMNNVHQFADNITILGLVELDGEAVESDTLEVGVFCNGKERGSGRAIYLENLDAYRIFLTAHGEEGDVLSFRLFDHNRDKERRIRCRQQLTFHADDHYGQLRNPYMIRFATDYDKHIEAEICEGQYYEENGFRVCLPGTYFQELTGKNGNDSIVRLDLTVHPVFHEEKEVVAVEFPHYYGDLSFDRPGTYTLPFQTEFGCDSIVVVKVVPYEGLRELMVSPVPANQGQRVTLFFPFTRAEQQGLKVEVFTLAGSLMQTKNPTEYPIELDPIMVSGTYMVKVTMGTGEVVTGKIIVK